MHYDTLRYDAETGDKRAIILLAELESLPYPTSFDYVGTLLLLGAMVLTIFGLTDGSEGGGWYVPATHSPLKAQTLSLLFLRSQAPAAANHYAHHRRPSLPALLLV